MTGPRQPRLLPAASYCGLKAAFRRLANDAGGQESLASITRVSQAQISLYGRPPGAATTEAYAPIDVVADAEADTGEPLVTRALAHLAGYILVKKPEAAARRVDFHDLAAFGKESGEALARLAQVLDDGQVTAQEAPEAIAELRDVQRVIAGIEQGLLAVLEGSVVRDREP